MYREKLFRRSRFHMYIDLDPVSLSCRIIFAFKLFIPSGCYVYIHSVDVCDEIATDK